MPDVAPDHAIVHLPDWLWGKDPAGFGAAARWKMEQVDGEPRVWRIGLTERRTGQPAELVRLHRVADGATLAGIGTDPSLQALAAMTLPVALPGVMNAPVQNEIQRIKSERPNDPTGVAFCINLASVAADGHELTEAIRQALETQLLPMFPRAAAYVIAHDPAVGLRVAATRILLQFDSDPSLLSRQPLIGPEGLAFESSRHLFSDTTLGLSAYLGPLFLSRAPWVWGFSTGRPGAIIAYSFGQLVLGRRSEASELLQLFSPGGRSAIAPTGEIGPASFDAAFRWWIEHLDRLLTEITDPCLHVDDVGVYDFLDHFESLLSVEQAFRNVQSLSAHDRDGQAKRALLFDALDVLAAVRPPALDEMCRLRTAKQALAEVEAEMDSVAAEVLLPRARSAVVALEDLQKGFFLPSRISGSGVRLPGKDGERVVPYDEAAGMYLRVLRNSVHGFGGRTGVAGERNRALLAAHNGRVPADLPDLAYLYLLRLLARPTDITVRRPSGDRGGPKPASSGPGGSPAESP